VSARDHAHVVNTLSPLEVLVFFIPALLQASLITIRNDTYNDLIELSVIGRFFTLMLANMVAIMPVPNDSSVLLIMRSSKHLSMCGLISVVEFAGCNSKVDDTSLKLNGDDRTGSPL
jgi:hypothetical protein